MCELLDKYENRGREQGLAQGMECVNELIKRLIGDGRSDEILQVVSDAEYQKRLMMEYGL